jgi:heat shock protein HslJ
MGTYTLDNDQITVREIAGIQMVCLNTSARRLWDALKDAEHGSIEGTLLTLYSSGGQTLAILERLPPRT